MRHHFWKIFNDFVFAFLIIAFVFFLIMLIMSTGCAPDSNRKPEAPKNHAPTLDSVIAVDSEYHGKEGNSEYGEYEPTDNFDWDQGECGDEYRMWIGENGDTIWE